MSGGVGGKLPPVDHDPLNEGGRDKNDNAYNMKHSLIIILHYKVKNQIISTHNLKQGVIQGSILWCPSGKLNSMKRDCPQKKHTIASNFSMYITDV